MSFRHHCHLFPWVIVLIAAHGLVATPVGAEDWPQWRGASGLGIWHETGIIDRFPAEGLQVAWRAPVRSGFAGPAVADGRIFLLDWMEDPQSRTLDGTERVVALDEQTGAVLWTHEWHTSYRMLMVTYAIGPRAGSVLISVQNRLSKKSGHGKRLIVEVDLLTKECSHDHSNEAYCEAPSDRSPDRQRPSVAQGVDEGSAPGGAGGGDDRGAGRWSWRAHGGPGRVSVRLLQPRPGAPHREVGAPSAAGPRGPLLDRAVCALPAVGEGAALAEMYVQGVSTRKVKAITEELCGHTFSASTVSRINKSLDALLRRFAQRRLDEAYPYVILDARYEKVRLDGVIQSQAVFIALGINEEGRRQVLGVELSNRESQSSWTTFVKGLKTRGLQGVEFVVSDDHAGIKRAVRELLPEAVWQRCYVHFLRNALDYLPRKADDDCRQELRWLYDRRNLKEAQQDLQAWLTRWEQRYPKLTDWVEAHIGETLNFYSLPRQHHKHLKSTNMLERLNEEIKRRTRVVRIFPNPASCLRLVRALCAETHEGWLEDHRYLNMDFWKEQKKDLVRVAA